MEEGDDAYLMLGVSEGATPAEIKKAYRKLALRHHPDKQKTEDDRKSATVIFAKISNAYEILSDERKRQKYDYERKNPNLRGGGTTNYDSDEDDGHFARHQNHHADIHDFFHRNHFQFHDPFQVFEQFFREEFGGGNGGSRGQSPFDDPFFSGGGFGMPSAGNPFGSFFGSSSMLHDPFGGSPFGGQRMDPFAAMQQQMQQQMQQMNAGNNFVSTTSVMSNSFPGAAAQGGTVSQSTTTRIVNGRSETVTETVIQKPDGTVERRVETVGADGQSRPRLTNQTRQRSDPSINSRSNEASLGAPKRKRLKNRGSRTER